MAKTRWLVGAVIVAAAAGGAFYLARNKKEAPKYRTTAADSGTVTSTVTATGTLSAVTTVAIGSQVSGIIAKLYVDFNSKVKKGQLLAELDPTPFVEAVNQQKANVEKAKADLHLAEATLTRQTRLRDLQLIAASDYDAAVGARDDAAAGLKQNQALLEQAQTNLNYTKISAPIDGIVVDREYNVGQTVAASFQAPLIFSIAQDLTKMQVLTSIDESDVGGIQIGQTADFTVDAYPDRTFHGSVSQIRLSTTTVQNVVTYPVMIDVPNLDNKLLPGMTASVQVPVDTRKSTLRVPNAALRFKPDDADVVHPPDEQPDAAAGTAAGGSGTGTAASGSQAPAPGAPGSGTAAGGPRGGSGQAPGGAAGAPGPTAAGGGARPGGARGGPGRKTGGGDRRTVVYVPIPGGNKLRPVHVVSSITDGTFTAVRSQELHAGDQVVIGLQTARTGITGTRGGGPPRF